MERGVAGGISAGIQDFTSLLGSKQNLERGEQAIRAGDQSMAIQAKQEERASLAADQSRRKSEYELQAAERQKKFDEAWYPVSSVAPNLEKMPKLKELFTNMAKQEGLGVKEDQTGLYAQGYSLSHIKNQFSSSIEFNKAATDAAEADMDAIITTGAQRLAKMQSGEEKAKPEDIEALQKQLGTYKQQKAQLLYQKESIQKELLKQAGAREVADIRGQATVTAAEKRGEATIEAAKERGAQAAGVAESNQAAALERTKETNKTRIQAAQISQAGFGGFAKLPEEDKALWYDTYERTKTLPPMAYRDSASRDSFTKGFAEYQRQKGNSGADVVVKQVQTKAQGMAMNDLTKREALQGTFIGKIEENAKTLRRIRTNYGDQYSRLVNVPVNKLAQLMGSGDYAALQLVVRSLSNEVAKVESGSLGVAEVSVEQAEAFNKIHDANMTLGDLMKVADTSLELGGNARTALKNQKASLLSEISGSEKQSGKSERDTTKAVSYLKTAKTRAQAIAQIHALLGQGWTAEELREIEKKANLGELK